MLAVLDAIWGVGTAAAAFFPQRIKRTIAEQTAELVKRHVGMAGEILARAILKKTEIPGFLHGHSSLESDPCAAQVFSASGFIEVVSFAVDDDSYGEILNLQTANGFRAQIIIGDNLRFFDAF